MKVIEAIKKERYKRFKVFVILWLAFVWIMTLGLKADVEAKNLESVKTDIEVVQVERVLKARREYLDRVYVQLRATREPKKIKKIVDRESGWSKYIETMDATEAEKTWLRKIIQCESRGDPLAKNKTAINHCKLENGSYTVSVGQTCEQAGTGVTTYSEHASGLLQVLPTTWKSWGCSGDIFNEYDAVDCGLWAYRQGPTHQDDWMCN